MNLCIKVKKYIEVKDTNDEKLKFVARKSLLTFYNFLSMISDFVNVFRIEFKKSMTRDRNEKKFRKISDASELNRFRFCDSSSVSTDAVKTMSTADAAKMTIVADAVETMSADDASDANDANDANDASDANDVSDASDATNDAASNAAAASLRERTVNNK